MRNVPSIAVGDDSADESREAKRLGILIAAARIFNERGYHRTSVADVAEALGVEPSELLDATSAKRAARKPGPASQLEQRIAALRELPRERQKVVLNVIDTFLRDAKAS